MGVMNFLEKNFCEGKKRRDGVMKKRVLWIQGTVILPFLVVTSCLGGDTQVAPLEGGLAHNPGKPPVQGEISLTVNPPTGSVLTGDTLQFSVSVSGTEDQRVTWSVVEGPSCGTISSTGLYTAPSVVPEGGKCHIKVTSLADPSKSVIVEITITTSVVGCVAPAIPGFSGYEDIYDNSQWSQVDGSIGPDGDAAIGIHHAHGIVDDGHNHFFLPDGNGGVRKIDLNVTPGQMTTVIDSTAWSAGGGSTSLTGIALLPNGDLVVSDGEQHVLWRVTQGGQMSLFAGVPGVAGYRDGPATGGGEGNALFVLDEAGLTVDGQGNVYVADDDNCAIRKISNGQVTTVAINPACQNVTPPQGAIVTDLFVNPTGVVMDCNGNLIVADNSADQIYRIILQGPNAGQVVVVAGIRNGDESIDHTDPLQASFGDPIAVSVDRGNNIIVSDHEGTFRRIAAGQNVPGADGTAPNGEVTSPLGPGQPGPPLEYIAFTRDGNPVLVINDQRIARTFYEPPPPGVSVVVSPRRIGLDTNEGIQMVALVFGTTEKSVTWEVVEAADCGTVDSNGYYIAPGSIPPGRVCHVKATSVADPTKSGTAEITIREQIAET